MRVLGRADLEAPSVCVRIFNLRRPQGQKHSRALSRMQKEMAVYLDYTILGEI